METIVFLDRDTLDAELRPPTFGHRWVNYGATRPEEVCERLREATVAVVNKVPLGAAALARLPRLKLIAVAATGTDNVDVDYCRARGVSVTNVRGYAKTSVPEHVFALALALRRQVVAYGEDLRRGRIGRGRREGAAEARPVTRLCFAARRGRSLRCWRRVGRRGPAWPLGWPRRRGA